MATAKIIELDETNTCKICDNALAKYSCPKCNILYCSLNCYQATSHLECSESFYKDNVMSQMQMDKDNEEMKKKMIEILQKVHESNRISLSEDECDETEGQYFTFNNDFNFGSFDKVDSDDEQDFLDIADRLEGVNLDNAEEVWEKLTEDEKQDFVAFLKSEDVSKLIPAWEPWWNYYTNEKIEDLAKTEDYKIKCPHMCSVKDFTEITKKAAAECVSYNLINILAAYAFTTRYFNGEHFDFAQEAASCIISLSLTLKSAENFNDFETAVKSVEQECVNSTWIISDLENVQTMREDLSKILKGPKSSEPKFYILCALSDIHHLLNKAILPVDAGNNGNFQKKFSDHFPAVQLECSEITNHIRKIDYYLSYAKDCYTAI